MPPASIRSRHFERTEPRRWPTRRKGALALTLARSYGVVSWSRLVTACNVIDAIWSDDIQRLRTLVEKRPALLQEMARGTEKCSWGPPMTYAANLGRDNIIRMLRKLGATDVKSAAGRAALQGHVATARMLYAMAGSPPVPKDAVMGPCEALNPEGLALALELGASICDSSGDWRAPVALLLETLLDRGMDVNVRAAIDAQGFGGHTPLFSAVVSFNYYVRAKYASPKPDRDPFAELLFNHGADPNARASLRTRIHSDVVHEYRDVTALGWDERFHDQGMVSRPAMRLIAQRGGNL